MVVLPGDFVSGGSCCVCLQSLCEPQTCPCVTANSGLCFSSSFLADSIYLSFASLGGVNSK